MKRIRRFKTDTFNNLYSIWTYITTYSIPNEYSSNLITTIESIDIPNSIEFLSYKWWIAAEHYVIKNSDLFENIQHLLFLYYLMEESFESRMIRTMNNKIKFYEKTRN